MAEVSQANGGGKRARGGRRSKKLSTRVDLTPMVDLGFLLITFFIFTTTMSSPKTMKVNLPAIAHPDNWMNVAESAVLTLIPSAGDSLYFYEGKNPQSGSYAGMKSARTLIMKKKLGADPEKFIVLLKPSASSTYGNVVHLLDEMLICNVRHYVMSDPEKPELLAMNPRQKQ